MSHNYSLSSKIPAPGQFAFYSLLDPSTFYLWKILFYLLDVGAVLFQLFLDYDLADLLSLLLLLFGVHPLLFMSHHFFACIENALETRRSVLLIFREHSRLPDLRRTSFSVSRILADWLLLGLRINFFGEARFFEGLSSNFVLHAIL